MKFITDKEQIKAGLIIFRRGDVEHDQYYCRVRIQNEDRYKTIALKTSDRQTARDRAMDQDADIRFRVKHDVPVFNRPFSQVAEEYADAQQRRANAGEVSQARAMNVKNKVNGPLNAYVGSSQIHLVGQDRWSEYPLWRRENGVGRRNGIISDSTIRIEMTILAAIMNYAVSKRYVPAHHRFEGMPKLKSARRDEFTLEEYRKLHSVGRKWMKEATTPQGIWYRQFHSHHVQHGDAPARGQEFAVARHCQSEGQRRHRHSGDFCPRQGQDAPVDRPEKCRRVS